MCYSVNLELDIQNLDVLIEVIDHLNGLGTVSVERMAVSRYDNCETTDE